MAPELVIKNALLALFLLGARGGKKEKGLPSNVQKGDHDLESESGQASSMAVSTLCDYFADKPSTSDGRPASNVPLYSTTPSSSRSSNPSQGRIQNAPMILIGDVLKIPENIKGNVFRRHMLPFIAEASGCFEKIRIALEEVASGLINVENMALGSAVKRIAEKVIAENLGIGGMPDAEEMMPDLLVDFGLVGQELVMETTQKALENINTQLTSIGSLVLDTLFDERRNNGLRRNKNKAAVLLFENEPPVTSIQDLTPEVFMLEGRGVTWHYTTSDIIRPPFHFFLVLGLIQKRSIACIGAIIDTIRTKVAEVEKQGVNSELYLAYAAWSEQRKDLSPSDISHEISASGGISKLEECRELMNGLRMDLDHFEQCWTSAAKSLQAPKMQRPARKKK